MKENQHVSSISVVGNYIPSRSLPNCILIISFQIEAAPAEKNKGGGRKVIASVY